MSTKRQQTHIRLLDAAGKLFRSDGVGVRLEDVAKEAGVSRQSVYLHFSSRAGLLVELFDYMDQRLSIDSVTKALSEALDARAALKVLVSERASYISEIHPFAGPLIAARKTDTAVEVAYEDRQSARRREYKILVERLDSEGLLSDDWSVESATETIRAILSIPTWELLVIERGWSSERYVESMQKVLYRTFINDG